MNLLLGPNLIPSADIMIQLTPDQIEELNALGTKLLNADCKEIGGSMQEHVHDESCSHVVEGRAVGKSTEVGEQAVRRGANLIVKSRAVGAATGLTPEQLQQLGLSLVANPLPGQEFKVVLTPEQIEEKRKARRQETVKNRRLRKSAKNKALAAAQSKYERRRVAKGASASDLVQSRSVTSETPKRARTLRREAARTMAKLSRKFSTKQAEPTQATGTNE